MKKNRFLIKLIFSEAMSLEIKTSDMREMFYIEEALDHIEMEQDGDYYDVMVVEFIEDKPYSLYCEIGFDFDDSQGTANWIMDLNNSDIENIDIQKL